MPQNRLLQTFMIYSAVWLWQWFRSRKGKPPIELPFVDKKKKPVDGTAKDKANKDRDRKE